jgi:hypothetical protein
VALPAGMRDLKAISGDSRSTCQQQAVVRLNPFGEVQANRNADQTCSLQAAWATPTRFRDSRGNTPTHSRMTPTLREVLKDGMGLLAQNPWP